MLVAPVDGERLADHLSGGMAAAITHRGEHGGIGLTGDDRPDDPHACGTGDAGHDRLQLEVHLRERLLHVLDMRGRIIEETLSLAQIRAQAGDLALGAEARAQQIIAVQSRATTGSRLHRSCDRAHAWYRVH